MVELSRILVVDDTAADRALIKAALADNDIELIEAANGEQALQLVAKQTFDLVLLDITMPGASGFEILTCLREKFSSGELPIIMVTSINDEKDIVRALNSGANDFMVKPIRLEILKARVIAQLSRKQAEKALRENEEMAIANEKKLRAILDATPDGIITIDDRGTIETFNPAAEKIFGYSVEDVVGKNVSILMPEPYHSEHDGYLKNFRDYGRAKIIGIDREVEGQRKDGSTFPLNLSVSKMYINGQIHFVGITQDITERKSADQALRQAHAQLETRVEERTRELRQSEARFKDYAEVSSDWFWEMGEDLRYNSFSGQLSVVQELLPTIVGKTRWEAIGVDPDKDPFWRTHQAALESRQPFRDFVYCVPDNRGVAHWFQISGVPVFDGDGRFGGYRGSGSEITDRMKGEQDLKESEERFRNLIEGSIQGVLIHADHRPLFANQAYAEIFGYDGYAEILAQDSALDHVAPHEHQRMIDYSRARLRGEAAPSRYEFEGIRKDGSSIWLENRAWVVNWKGQRAGQRTVIDITDRKRAEAQIIQSAKLATIGEMASGIAHELNQPLNIIRMSAETSLMWMEEGTLDIGVQKDKLALIEDQVDRMAKIIDHMRVFVRDNKSAAEGIFSPVTSLNSVATFLEQQFTVAGIDLEKNIPEECGQIRGSLVQFEQVFMNLLTNAKDAVIERSEMMASAEKAFKGKVRLEVIESVSSAMVSVTDNGGGISNDLLTKIFDPFFTTKEEGVGTGLGLSISYKIIESMGGSIEVANVDLGTRFEVSLPLVDGALLDKEETRKPEQDKKREDRLKRHRVLIVDDEVMAVESLAEHLEGKGYEAVTASNGVAALEAFRSSPADVVITDLRMPEMDGRELIRRLREISPLVPIFVTTGHTTVGVNEDITVEGATRIVKKPIHLREVVEMLDWATKAWLHDPKRRS